MDARSARWCSTTSNPCFSSQLNCCILEFSNSAPSAFTSVNAKNFTFLLAVISLFSWRTEPLHRFLGFLYLASTSSICSLIRSKSLYPITASPRRISSPWYGIWRGRLRNTFALLVMTSPTSPFPLVTAFWSRPFWYVRTIVSPSIFQEITTFCSPKNDFSCSTSFVLSSESIGFSCRSFGSSLSTSYPTLTVGLDARVVPSSRSSPSSSSYNLSYS